MPNSEAGEDRRNFHGEGGSQGKNWGGGGLISQMWKKSDVHYEGEVLSHVADID